MQAEGLGAGAQNKEELLREIADMEKKMQNMLALLEQKKQLLEEKDESDGPAKQTAGAGKEKPSPPAPKKARPKKVVAAKTRAPLFMAQAEEFAPAPEPRKAKSFVYWGVWTLNFCVLIVMCIAALLFSVTQISGQTVTVKPNEDYSAYASILTAEEKKEWQEKKVDPNKAMVQLEQLVEVEGGSNARLRLINPPYSAFMCDVQLVLPQADKDEVLYTQKDVRPGTVVEYITLGRQLLPGEYEARVDYTFYDALGAEKGSYSMQVTLVAK